MGSSDENPEVLFCFIFLRYVRNKVIHRDKVQKNNGGLRRDANMCNSHLGERKDEWTREKTCLPSVIKSPLEFMVMNVSGTRQCDCAFFPQQ